MTVQLPQVLIRNSFNILGLSSSATLKEIKKRAQHLLQFAKIEEVQEFDIDIGHVCEFRNENEVRVALERLSGIKDRLREVFFWFDDHNVENQKAITLISKGNYSKSIDILEKTDKASVEWLKYKNLALALFFQAFDSFDIKVFRRSLESWKSIVESDEFWNFYEKYYLLHDELGTSSSLFQEFRASIYESLSAQTVSFYHQTQNPEVVGIYYHTFGQIGKSTDVEVLQPIVLKIKKEIEELEKIASESIDNASLVKRVLKKIHNQFLELDKFALSEYSPLTVLRNDSAEKLRSISIDIYNKDDNIELALIFLDLGAKFAISDVIANKIEADKKQLKENILWKTISPQFDSVKEFIAERKIEEAKSSYLKLDDELAKKDDESVIGIRVTLLISFCSQLVEKGHELFEQKKFGIEILAIDGLLNGRNHRDAILAFEYVVEVLENRISLLSFVELTSDRSDPLKVIDNMLASLKSCELPNLIYEHESCLKLIDVLANGQENENTQIAIRLLGGAVCYSIVYRRIRGLKQKKMWKWIGWGAAIAFYFLVVMDNDIPTPKSSHKPTYRASSSPPTSPSQILTYEENQLIQYMQKNEPDLLKTVRKEGYSDKEIAQYVLKLAEEEE